MHKEIELSRWRDRPLGVGYRRMTIAAAGLRQIVRTKVLAGVVILSWVVGLGIPGLAFLVSQAVGTGGLLDQIAQNMPGLPAAIVAIIGGMLTLYPDVWIGGVYTVIFWLHSYAALAFSLVALTVLIPQLIARDRGTGALVIYLSRPLTSTDYLLAKLGMIAGVLALTWIGPLLFGWVASLLVAPGRDFVLYSIEPLLRALAYAGIAFVALAAIALAVSALNRTSGGAIMTWMGIWLVAAALSNIGDAPDWLRRASFSYDLKVLRKEAFRLDESLVAVRDSIPLASQEFLTNLTVMSDSARPSSPAWALVALGLFVAGSAMVFTRRLRPE